MDIKGHMNQGPNNKPFDWIKNKNQNYLSKSFSLIFPCLKSSKSCQLQQPLELWQLAQAVGPQPSTKFPSKMHHVEFPTTTSTKDSFPNAQSPQRWLPMTTTVLSMPRLSINQSTNLPTASTKRASPGRTSGATEIPMPLQRGPRTRLQRKPLQNHLLIRHHQVLQRRARRLAQVPLGRVHLYPRPIPAWRLWCFFQLCLPPPCSSESDGLRGDCLSTQGSCQIDDCHLFFILLTYAFDIRPVFIMIPLKGAQTMQCTIRFWTIFTFF